jgi:DNA-binding MarR family transcriptional regulator
VQNTHKRDVLRRLHEALIDVVGFFNRPQNDVILLREAGVSLDRALFPLLVLIERRGPLGVGELADRVGRDYTTVSRQVAKLESLGLVTRRSGKTDRRVTEAVVTIRAKPCRKCWTRHASGWQRLRFRAGARMI